MHHTNRNNHNINSMMNSGSALASKATSISTPAQVTDPAPRTTNSKTQQHQQQEEQQQEYQQ